MLRSFSQGYLNVVAPLYLLSLGVSGAGLGALFTGSFLIGALLTLAVGFLADRYGRRPFLIVFSLLMLAWGAAYASTTFLPLLLTVSSIAGIDRGGGNVAGGQAGPFAPAESAILADLVPRERRHAVFSLNSFLATAAAALGTGLVSSMIVVWFNLRFHVGADAIGPMLTVSYVLTAISVFVGALLAQRLGSVRAIVITRLMAATLVLVLALAPTFLIAAVFQVARQVVSQMITPVRQSFTMGLVSSEERASVSGLTGLFRRLSASASPTVTGVLIDQGALELPFFASALLQVISAALYYRFFLAPDDAGPTAERPAARVGDSR